MITRRLDGVAARAVRVRFALPLALAALSLAAAARADICTPRNALSPCLAADNLWANSAGPFTWLAPATTALPRSVAFGMLVSYVYRPIGLSLASADPSGTVVYAVEHALTANLLATIGVSSRLAFDVAAPFRLYQLGAGAGFASGSLDGLPKTAVGDLRFGPAVSILRRHGDRGLDLAARFHLVAPTGHPRAFISSPSATFAPGVSLAYHSGRFIVSGDAGARIRAPVELGSAVIGSQVSLGAGASFEVLRESWLTIGAEVFALFDVDRQTSQISAPGELAPRTEPSSDPLIPAEWLVTLRTGHLLDRHFRATLGAGGLIPTGPTSDVTAPAFRAIAAVSFVP